jgi:hypothetical protein
MAEANHKSGTPNEFELYDQPRGGRIAGIGMALLGAAFIGGVWYEFPVLGQTERIGALVAGAIGLFAVFGGLRMFWRSRRAPYLILRANPSGLTVVERFRFHGEPIYLQLPWAKVRDFRLRQMGEAGYAMEVHADLPPQEEERIRYEQKFTSPPGTLLFEVPVRWLPTRDEWIGDTLRAIATRARNGAA